MYTAQMVEDPLITQSLSVVGVHVMIQNLADPESYHGSHSCILQSDVAARSGHLIHKPVLSRAHRPGAAGIERTLYVVTAVFPVSLPVMMGEGIFGGKNNR